MPTVPQPRLPPASSSRATGPAGDLRPRNFRMSFNGVELPVADQMKWYDVWGTDQTYNHFAVLRAWAFDTPYKWTKQIPSFFGGTQ